MPHKRKIRKDNETKLLFEPDDSFLFLAYTGVSSDSLLVPLDTLVTLSILKFPQFNKPKVVRYRSRHSFVFLQCFKDTKLWFNKQRSKPLSTNKKNLKKIFWSLMKWFILKEPGNFRKTEVLMNTNIYNFKSSRISFLLKIPFFIKSCTLLIEGLSFNKVVSLKPLFITEWDKFLPFSCSEYPQMAFLM